MRIKKAFTLAEIMVVLTIIGVLTMILLPIANHSRPDENVMKFKKADTTLKNVIRELVNSDKYYADGDLGIRKLANGTSQLIDGTHDGDFTYLCLSIAEILTTKNINCTGVSRASGYAFHGWIDLRIGESPSLADLQCKGITGSDVDKVISGDGITFYQSNPKATFGMTITQAHNAMGANTQGDSRRIFSDYFDTNGFDASYKTFCIDIDGIPNDGSSKCDDIKDVCPFGYGIRADGKFLNGARADEWLEKGFQKGANDN